VQFDFEFPAIDFGDGGVYDYVPVTGFFVYESTIPGSPLEGFPETSAQFTGGLLDLQLFADGAPVSIGPVLTDSLRIRDDVVDPQDFEEDGVSLVVDTATTHLVVTGFEFVVEGEPAFIDGLDAPTSFGQPFGRGSLTIDGPNSNDGYNLDSSASRDGIDA